MSNMALANRLERASRLSAILMALGALVVLAALVLASDQLRTLQSEVQSLRSEADKQRAENEELRRTATGMHTEIQGLMEALTASRKALIAFHQRDYGAAVDLYDQALQSDPKNAYLLNLKAYSLFKLKRFDEAIKVQSQSVSVDPGYAWGFFDLARFQCAVGAFEEARQAIKAALEMRPDLRATMEGDGEFRTLCAPVLN